MKYIALILGTLVLFSGTVMADTEITSLPFTASTHGERYYLTGDLDWPGNPTGAAITVTANSVEIDLGGYTITYGSADSGRVTGIRVSADSVLIHNGRVFHIPTDSSLDLNYCHAIDGDDITYLTMRGLNLSTTGTVVENTLWRTPPYDVTSSGRTCQRGIHTIYLTGTGSHHNRAVSCTVNNATVGYFERSDRPTSAVCVNYTGNAGITDVETDYTLKLDSNLIYSSWAGAILGNVDNHVNQSWGVFHVEHNKVVMRARNDGPHSGYRYGNAFAFDYYHAGLVRSQGNRIEYDSTQPLVLFGGQGMFLVSTGGDGIWTSDTNYFTNDTIIVGGGPDMGLVSGIKIRGNTLPTIFSGLYIEAHANTNTSDSTVWDEANCVEIGHSYSAADWDNPYVAFENCTFNAIDESGGSDLAAMFYRFQPSGYGYRLFTSGCKFTTDGVGFSYMDYDYIVTDEPEADSIFSYSDTFVLGTNHNGVALFRTRDQAGGTHGGDAKWNYIINPTYQNGGSFGFLYGNAFTQDLTEQVEMVVTVEDGDGNPINGATVWCLNSAQTDTVFKKTSNASGLVYDTVSTNFISRTATDTTLAQYNDFTVGAAYTGDTSTVTWTITLTDNDTTLTLGDVNLSQSNVVVDTNNTSAYIQTTFTAIDSAVRWYKLLWGTSNPPTVKYGDSITSPTNPDTFVVSPLIQNTKYYFMTVARDSVTTDTSAVDSITTLKTRAHTVTVTDTNEVNFVVVDDYTANSVDSIWLVWDDDSDMADSLGRFVITSGITDPDTMIAGGLSGGTLYYYRVRLVDQLGISSSSVQSVTTITPALDRPVVLNDNIRISGKVIIK